MQCECGKLKYLYQNEECDENSRQSEKQSRFPRHILLARTENTKKHSQHHQPHDLWDSGGNDTVLVY